MIKDFDNVILVPAMSRLLLFLLTATVSADAIQQADLDYMGTFLDIKIAIEDNLKQNGMKHKLSLNMTNIGNGVVRKEGWTIYFCSFFMIEPDHLPSAEGYILPHYFLKVNHIQGCLFSMTPTNGFPTLFANDRHFVEFYGQFWTVSRTDIPPNWYVAAPALKPVNIQSTFTGKRFVTDFTSPKQWKRYRNDQYNPYTAQERFRKYDDKIPTNFLKLVIPTPKDIQIHSNNSLKIHNMTVVCTPDIKEEAVYLS
ncbi:beta-hexosaminidase-like, partial [Saccostrea cucullata]|uniref:beta-hexosaminidase-like n=1 Tax=Saccostrea cuccullata TaxID=36930 RepID=UPI002ED292D1